MDSLGLSRCGRFIRVEYADAQDSLVVDRLGPRLRDCGWLRAAAGTWRKSMRYGSSSRIRCRIERVMTLNLRSTCLAALCIALSACATRDVHERVITFDAEMDIPLDFMSGDKDAGKDTKMPVDLPNLPGAHRARAAGRRCAEDCDKRQAFRSPPDSTVAVPGCGREIPVGC